MNLEKLSKYFLKQTTKLLKDSEMDSKEKLKQIEILINELNGNTIDEHIEKFCLDSLKDELKTLKNNGKSK